MIIYHEYGLHENTTSPGDHVERLKAHIANLLSGLGNFSNGPPDANVSSCVLSNANCIQFHREIQFHLAMIHASILSPTFFSERVGTHFWFRSFLNNSRRSRMKRLHMDS